VPDLHQPCLLPLRYNPVELGPVPGVLTALRDKLKRHREVGASMIELSGHAIGRVGRAGDRPNCMATRVCATRRCVTGWGERTHRWAVAAARLKLRAARPGRRQAGWEQP
jgi:hypothetical protein